ncbi:MAG: SCO family protein [Saprospiraceae bacterium]|nr:SCO family protein [Saprospiraceae bacterium]
MITRLLCVGVVPILLLTSCQPRANHLPILGEKELINGDTNYYSIPPFSFIDQDSQYVSQSSLRGKIYVADFFFTSCPTICPKVKAQMLRVNDKFSSESQVAFLSHSIDYRRDSVPVLARYAQKLGITSDKWHLVQLSKEQIESVANQYFNIAFEDETAPGGFDHSGRLILVDRQGRIRSYCDGTDQEDVDRFMEDIQLLLDEE